MHPYGVVKGDFITLDTLPGQRSVESIPTTKGDLLGITATAWRFHPIMCRRRRVKGALQKAVTAVSTMSLGALLTALGAVKARVQNAAG